MLGVRKSDYSHVLDANPDVGVCEKGWVGREGGRKSSGFKV